MTTADHSPSRACYLRGCASEQCERAAYLYMKQLYIDYSHGRRRTCSATQSRAHIDRLLAADWTQAEIAKAADLTHSMIADIRNGRPTIYNRTALAVLSIPVGPPPGPRPVDATGTVRRLRALIRIAHSIETITAETGMSRAKLSRITAGHFETISVDTAASIARAYRRLVTVPGKNPGARQYAKNKGWHGPLAWDDIDDPACKPEYMRRSEARASTKPKVYADPDRVAELTAQNKSAAEIALQLGCHQRTVVRIRGRVAEQAVAA
ncbi:hypothetical protein ACWGH2_29435 [Streptomyces sp. NPDC054871]